MTLNYQKTLDKALSKLRQLDINEALTLFNQLLQEHPNDLELINRIYLLANRKKNTDSFRIICHHIFSLDSKSTGFHQCIIATLNDYKHKFELELDPKILTTEQVFNLFFHLGQTGNTKDSHLLKDYIKKNLSEHSNTASALLIYSEQLINKKNLLLAQKELEYLMIYYAEAHTTITAENLLKKIRQQLKLVNG